MQNDMRRELWLNLTSEVSTGSGSDWVSIYVNIEIGQDRNPVAIAPGTDSIERT